jgi:hypothetical protein
MCKAFIITDNADIGESSSLLFIDRQKLKFTQGATMKLIIRQMKCLWVASLIMGVVACSESTDVVTAEKSSEPLLERVTLNVYKSQSCSCCEQWVEHVETLDFETVVHHPANLSQLKAEKGISPRYQSCHTAVSNSGYVFEGHIPARIIQQFLADPPPNSIGLAVPGMPVGSPGMEMENRHDDYDVLLLKQDGNSAVYKHITAKL